MCRMSRNDQCIRSLLDKVTREDVWSLTAFIVQTYTNGADQDVAERLRPSDYIQIDRLLYKMIADNKNANK